MKIQATVKTIGALREGVSKTTGNPYKALDVLVEWADGEYYQRQMAMVTGEHASQFLALGIHTGDVIGADIQLTTDSWGNRVYNKAILRNVVKNLN